uniref:RAB19, member RAS oncogene family n=1 Tax=Hucho hucho TaxID=62062 RepID=A0A4W5N2F5_9TELE
MDESFDFLFKIILIGDSNVGKTCVVQSFKSGQFSERQQNTIGVDFTVRTVDIEGKKIKMQVWDTAGQERFRTITQSYYRSAHGAMIAYDITRHGTFDSVSHWIREVELYGNKSDLESERQVLFQEACCMAEERGILAALETSAKESQNVDDAFMMMARELLARNGMAIRQQAPSNNDSPRVLLRANSRSINGPAVITDKKTCC